MTRKPPHKPHGSHAGPRPQPRPASAAPPRRQHPQAETHEPDLAALAMEHLAQKVHPELVLAIQERANAKDPAWLTLVSLAVDATGVVHPLLAVQPGSLRLSCFGPSSSLHFTPSISTSRKSHSSSKSKYCSLLANMAKP